MFGNYFIEHAIRAVPRSGNMIFDSLEVVVGISKTPMDGKKEHKVFIRNRPSIPDNSRYWQVVEDHEHINIFLELSYDFANTQIDNENSHLKNIQDSEGGEEGIDEC